MAVRHFRITLLVCALTLLAVCAALATTRFTRLWSRSAAVPPVQPGVAQKIAESEDVLSAGLDANEKKLLWDIEHHGNLLTKFGFTPDKVIQAAKEQLARVRRAGSR